MYQRQAYVIISILGWKLEEWEADLEIQQTLQFPSGGLTESMEVICGMKRAGISCSQPKTMENVERQCWVFTWWAGSWAVLLLLSDFIFAAHPQWAARADKIRSQIS